MIRRPPRSTRTDTLSLHDALPIFEGRVRVELRIDRGRFEPTHAHGAHGAHVLPDKSGLMMLQRLTSFSLVEGDLLRSEEHTSELQSLMRISYAVFCLQKKNNHT